MSHKKNHKKAADGTRNYKSVTEYQNIRLPEVDHPQFAMYHLYIQSACVIELDEKLCSIKTLKMLRLKPAMLERIEAHSVTYGGDIFTERKHEPIGCFLKL